MKDEVDELFIGVRCEGGGYCRLVESVFGHGLPHLLERVVEFGLRKTGAGRELAGALQLRIQGGAFGTVDADSSDKDARRTLEDEVHDLDAG